MGCTAAEPLGDLQYYRLFNQLQQQILEAVTKEQPVKPAIELICRSIEQLASDVAVAILSADENGRVYPLAAPSMPAGYMTMFYRSEMATFADCCVNAVTGKKPVMVTDLANDARWQCCSTEALVARLQSCWAVPVINREHNVIGVLIFYFRQQQVQPSVLHQQLAAAFAPLCLLVLQREQHRQHVHRLACFDSLTALPNRNLLHTRAERAVQEAESSKSLLAVLFIGLDRLKQINDAFGHIAGDQLLQVIARRLYSGRRQSDITGRLSGDEFVMVLPNCGQPHITEIVKKIQSSLVAPCHIAGNRIVPSVSIGISLYPEDGADITTLLLRADIAMQQAKNMRRGSVGFFNHELNKKARQRQLLTQALREALEHDALQLNYQPQVNLRSGQLYGAEALARWHHPELGTIAPAQFIPLAEECGLITALDMWAVRTACKQLSIWHQQGLNVPSVSVNLSPSNFHNPHLPRLLAEVLRQYQLQPAQLILELTENVLMAQDAATLDALHAVSQLGIRLAMDDFGTGYSSLSYLRHLPITELKLDRSFIKDLLKDQSCQILSEAVLRIGKSLNLAVVAEGIELPAQYVVLQQQGYDVAQGYFISKPLTAAQFARWLTEYFKL